MSADDGNIFEKLLGPVKASKWRSIRFWLIVGSAIGLGVVALIVLILANAFGEKLSAIRLTYIGQGNEIRDAAIPLMDKKELLPDYRLEVFCETDGLIFTRKKYECGPTPNRSAEQPINFTFAGETTRERVLQINLLESDPVKDDLVASVQVSGLSQQADGYRFEMVTQKSLRFGFERIWKGEFGFAVVITILSMGFCLVLGLGELMIELLLTAVLSPTK
jgi:hypothetical protein